MKSFGFRALHLARTIGFGLLVISTGRVAAANTGTEMPPDLKSVVIADRYRVEGSAASGYYAWNAANQIEAGFRGNSTEIEVKGKHLKLTLTSYGWGGRDPSLDIAIASAKASLATPLDAVNSCC